MKWTVVWFSFMNSVNVWLVGFLFEHGTLLVGSTLCVFVSGGLALFSRAGGWPGYLTVGWLATSLVRLWQLFWYQAFIQQSFVCVYLYACVCGGCHLTWYHLRLRTCCQLCIQTDEHCTHLYGFIQTYFLVSLICSISVYLNRAILNDFIPALSESLNWSLHIHSMNAKVQV